MLTVNVLGLSLVALIVWWFWLWQAPETDLRSDQLVIVVEGGVYQPARIKLPANQPASLSFLRRDDSPCAETVLIPELQFSASLPLNKTIRVELPPLKKGEYAFHCQMQMYRGLLIAE